MKIVLIIFTASAFSYMLNTAIERYKVKKVFEYANNKKIKYKDIK